MNDPKDHKKIQNYLQPRHPYFQWLLQHQKKILILTLLIVILTPLITNLALNKPFLVGEETYYHLAAAENYEWKEALQNPLIPFIDFWPKPLLFLYPLILSVLIILLAIRLLKEFNLTPAQRFTFLLFAILSPAFIYSFVSLSAYAFFLFLVLAGMHFILKARQNSTAATKKWLYRGLAAIVLIPAAFFDLLSSLLLLIALTLFLYLKRKKESESYLLLALSGTIILILKLLVLKTPLIYGPYHLQQPLADLITDLGGQSGIQFFILLLAFIGLMGSWKKKNLYRLTLFIVPIVLAYWYSSQAIFFLSLSASFFAALGFMQLFERKWLLITLKDFTVLLLILGVLFSTITYLDRLSETGPQAEDRQVLTWIKENTNPNSLILTLPEESYYVQYFAQRNTFYSPHSHLTEKERLTTTIFNAGYIDELFPLLEQEQIKFIYVTPEMKSRLPADQGLLFLLKNERLVLVHSQGEVGVWVFN